MGAPVTRRGVPGLHRWRGRSLPRDICPAMRGRTGGLQIKRTPGVVRELGQAGQGEYGVLPEKAISSVREVGRNSISGKCWATKARIFSPAGDAGTANTVASAGAFPEIVVRSGPALSNAAARSSGVFWVVFLVPEEQARPGPPALQLLGSQNGSRPGQQQFDEILAIVLPDANVHQRLEPGSDLVLHHLFERVRDVLRRKGGDDLVRHVP